VCVLDIHGVFLYTGGIMMTKKDYIAIAKIINKFGKVEHMLLLKMCEYFKKDNPNFDADKFIEACCE
jgi:hypothetical protein|tara:strand:- start:495 stop:695 length:201 start_codon:yes stop_codon:yes gene_type:complete